MKFTIPKTGIYRETLTINGTIVSDRLVEKDLPQPAPVFYTRKQLKRLLNNLTNHLFFVNAENDRGGCNIMSPNVRKAYRQYMEKHNLKPTLCTYPTLYFLDQDGQTIKKDIQAVYQDLGWSLNTSTGKWSPAKNRKKEKADGSR